jgi:D-glycero-D-manno-heptose 1,7-bisphosphate phosphatase
MSESQSAVFLDRDGVVNVDFGYVGKVSEFQFVDGIFDLVRIFQDSGKQVFVVTNQAGIGRGLYSVRDFDLLNQYMLDEFSKRGLLISKTYYCPHHPTAATGVYLKECDCRKPNPGMLFEAAREYNLSLSTSLLVGDKHSDIYAGHAAGLGTLIYIGEDTPDKATHSFGTVRELVNSGFAF